MSKKMKGVVYDSSTYGSYEDAKARVKHQALLQDYQELQKEAEAARNKLETMKQRKLTLLAEVRFLRRRCKFLRKNKPLKPPHVQELAKPQPVESHLLKNKKKDRIQSKKEATLQNLPPIFNLNQKGRVRVFMEKKVTLPNITSVLNLNHKDTSRGAKEAAPQKAIPASERIHKGKPNRGKEVAPRKSMPIIDLNQKEWTNSGAALRSSAPAFDLDQKVGSLSSKEAAVGTRAPVFDLNQISREEEEFQENCEAFRFEEPRKVLVRGGLDEQQHNDLMLSVCRNIGDGSTSRPGKRKISWQDPVALRV